MLALVPAASVWGIQKVSKYYQTQYPNLPPDGAVCLYKPWILHPVWIIHPVLGFIGFSLKPKVLGVCNAPSTNGSYGYIGIGGGNLLTLPTPVVKPNTTPAVI